VPFLFWGPGMKGGAGRRLTEADALMSGILLEDGYRIMDRLVRG